MYPLIELHLSQAANNEYSDVICGDLYKDLSSRGIFDGKYVTMTMNTDGIPVFHSSGYSFWPIYLTINEIPFKLR